VAAVPIECRGITNSKTMAGTFGSQFALDANLMAIEKFNGFLRLLNSFQDLSKVEKWLSIGCEGFVYPNTHTPHQK